MRRIIPLARALVLLCALVFPLVAQEDPCTQRTFLVTVIDREGNPVRGLTAAHFRGKFRGKPVQIESAIWETSPRRMVILLDASGSMLDPNKWETAKQLTYDAARLNLDGYSVALIIFAGRVLETIGFDGGFSALVERLSA